MNSFPKAIMTNYHKLGGLKHNIQKTKIGIWSHHFMANRWGNNGNSDTFYFGGALKSLHMVTAAMKLKDAYSLEGKL